MSLVYQCTTAIFASWESCDNMPFNTFLFGLGNNSATLAKVANSLGDEAILGRWNHFRPEIFLLTFARVLCLSSYWFGIGWMEVRLWKQMN